MIKPGDLIQTLWECSGIMPGNNNVRIDNQKVCLFLDAIVVSAGFDIKVLYEGQIVWIPFGGTLNVERFFKLYDNG